MLLVALTAGVTGATASEVGRQPPPLSMWEGRFSGPGSKGSHMVLRNQAPTVLQWFGGTLPARCVKGGEVRVAGRGGAIIFNRNSLPQTFLGKPTIGVDGSFAFGFRHGLGDPYGEAYTVWISGTFDANVVRGRVHGVSTSQFWGKCRGDRTFTSRRKGG